MDPTEIIAKYKKFLQRINYSEQTVKGYFKNIKNFCEWLIIPLEEVTENVIYEYIGLLHNRRLKPKTINSYLNAIRRFYYYLQFEERINIANPVKPVFFQILPKPLPQFLTEQEIKILFTYVIDKRDFDMFLLMF